MPYKYKNVLNIQASGEATREMLHGIQHIEHGPGTIDFNAITPMPPWVKGSEALRESWCIEHWGVMENASGLTESADTYDGGETIEFDTIGGDVRDLMRKLSMMFPRFTIVLDYLWASEDVGKDIGAAQFMNGEQTYEYIPELGSATAYEAAFDVFGTTAADHGLVFDDALGTYRYDGALISHGEDGDGQE